MKQLTYILSQTIDVFTIPCTTCSSRSLPQSVAASRIDVAAVSLISCAWLPTLTPNGEPYCCLPAFRFHCSNQPNCALLLQRFQLRLYHSHRLPRCPKWLMRIHSPQVAT
jgi:hypothetical protein